MDNVLLPSPIQPLIDAYLHTLEPLRGHFYGVYIYGSIALGAFEEAMSDIDVIVLTQGEWSALELRQLAALHEQLIREQPWGKRLEVLYVPVNDLGKDGREIAPYPCVHDGQFLSAGQVDVNGVTWWVLKHKGICLLGVERDALPFDYTWQQVLDTMRFNLDVYFAGKLKQPSVYLHTGMVEFSVSNLCRILTTIEDGEIVSKSASLEIWRTRLPERWWKLLDEAWRIRHQSTQPSLYRLPWLRMRETLAFIRYVRERGGKILKAALVEEVL